MNLPTRQPPRFVPTLTEVVEPLAALPAAASPAVNGHDINVDALIARICEQVQPMLARRLQQESQQWLRATLAQYLHETSLRIQDDMASLVRQAVMDALKTHNRTDPADAPVNR